MKRCGGLRLFSIATPFRRTARCSEDHRNHPRAGEPKIVLWIGCGGHYRPTQLIGCVLHHWPKKSGKDFQLCFGVEHHMKSWMDFFFGTLDARIREAEVSTPLRTVEDLIGVFGAACSSLPLPRPEEQLVNYKHIIQLTTKLTN